jgi:5-methyltetrahydropteroyltriglutamate--homocysteine methyltransferase
MAGALLTTSVGSLPKPPELQQARNRVARGQMDPQELAAMERQATQEWIRAQEEMGLDILVDGEMYRGDMVAYFSEQWTGFKLSGLVRSYGNRYYRKPIAVKQVGAHGTATLDWWKYAQGLTDRPVKGMLTGPYTMADWSFNEHYPTRETFILDLARVIHREALALEKAGARYIQIDEPAVSTRPEEMELAARALGIVTKGLSAYTITHICYGDFDAVFDQLLHLPVNNLDLETANSGYALLEQFRAHPSEMDLSLGVTDVHTHLIETVDQVKQGILLGLETLPAERLFIGPDCGLKTRTRDEALAKLKVMVQAVREVKAEQGIS